MDGVPVLSCMMLALACQDRQITTIEGIALDEKTLHPLQTAFVENGAVQCGYCIPGMIMSAKALLDNNPTPTEADVRLALSGNTCRCTGYVKQVKAVLAAAESGQG
jgi:carbon-monoxide dehydrogenase small subunit